VLFLDGSPSLLGEFNTALCGDFGGAECAGKIVRSSVLLAQTPRDPYSKYGMLHYQGLFEIT
jgi:hypothetical protein